MLGTFMAYTCLYITNINFIIISFIESVFVFCCYQISLQKDQKQWECIRGTLGTTQLQSDQSVKVPQSLRGSGAQVCQVCQTDLRLLQSVLCAAHSCVPAVVSQTNSSIFKVI